MPKTLSDGCVEHDEIVGVCPKSECHGDLHPVPGWGAWISETCDACRCSWTYQEPYQNRDIATAAGREAKRREKLAAGPAA